MNGFNPKAILQTGMACKHQIGVSTSRKVRSIVCSNNHMEKRRPRFKLDGLKTLDGCEPHG